MHTRQLTHDDLDDIKSCIFHHTTLYGIPLDHTRVFYILKNLLTVGKVYGCYDNEECVGIASQHFWKQMPVWIFSNVYVKNDKSTLRLTNYYSEVIISLMSAAIEFAETKDYFEFYYVLRDNLKTSRKKTIRKVIETLDSDLLLQRYEIENIHFLSSAIDLKWDYMHVLLGDAGVEALNHNKTLVVRRGRLTKAARETR